MNSSFDTGRQWPASATLIQGKKRVFDPPCALYFFARCGSGSLAAREASGEAAGGPVCGAHAVDDIVARDKRRTRLLTAWSLWEVSRSIRGRACASANSSALMRSGAQQVAPSVEMEYLDAICDEP